MSQFADADWSVFWHSNRLLLRRICLRWSRGNEADADDLLAEACVRSLGSACGEADAKLATSLRWWTTVIANLARERFRNEKRRYRLLDQRQLFTPLDSEASVEHRFLARESLAHTLAKTAALSTSQEYALLSRGVGTSYADIACRLGTSNVSARKIVQQARAMLRAVTRLRRATASRDAWARRSTVNHVSSTNAELRAPRSECHHSMR